LTVIQVFVKPECSTARYIAVYLAV